MKRSILLLAVLFVAFTASSLAQVTTGAMSGSVTMKDGKPISGARVVATHVPSGSKYGAIVGATGRYVIQSLRIGGPYTVEVSAVGMNPAKFSDITIVLGQTYVLDSKLEEGAVKLSEITVTSKKGSVMSNERTGAATNINKDVINNVPTLSRNIIDFAKVTPQANGRSFGGQDNRLNNLTIDGSVFNNSFGLSGVPGGQTGQSPISLDAVEEVQVNIAPYDVRQGGFTGAGINAVTRSGDNEWRFSVFANTRNQGFAGDTIAGLTAAEGAAFNRTPLNTSRFNVLQVGGRLSGPIIQDKLFFFLNYERENNTVPGTNYRAARPGEAPAGVITRAQSSTLDSLRQFLITRYNYDPGPYEGYDRTTFSDKATGKLTWNIDESNKFNIRFQYLRSQADILVSNSFSGLVPSGNRNGTTDALNFANANYFINNDIYSAIAELNSVVGSTISNNLIIGFTANRDYRDSRSRPFPLVDILQGGTTVTSFGYELFTPFNKLDTDTWQLQDNLTIFAGDHTITAGVSAEAFRFVNGFNPRYYGYYRFNSVQDFYNSANGVRVPVRIGTGATARDTMVVQQPSVFSQTYSALPNGATPLAETRAYQLGVYAQDEWNVNSQLKITLGLRVDAPIFDQSTAIANRTVDTTTFFNEITKTPERLSTGSLPAVNLLWSPRFGFNYDVTGDRSVQIRGGSGLFSGRPPFVWLSNVITNNGVTVGDILNVSSAASPILNRQFDTSVTRYIPANASMALPPTFTANSVTPGFRFPQLWRSNLAADIQLPFGLIATVEGLYSTFLSQAFYRDANLRPSTTNFAGPDQRPRFAGGAANRINPAIIGNFVLDNATAGDSWSGTVQLQKQYSDNWSAMVAYTYSVSRDVASAGSIAAGSWQGVQVVGSPNIPVISFSDNDNPHRLIATAAYKFEFGEAVALNLSAFYELRTQGRYTYTYAGDMNLDGVANNDLMYVPARKEDVVLLPLTAGGRTLSPDQQWDLLDAFIKNDPYLTSRRGQYTERNGGLRGWVSTLDLAASVDVNFMAGEKKNTVQFRVDLLNALNIINPSWGVNDRIIQNGGTRILSAAGPNTAGIPQFRLQEVGAGRGLARSPLTNGIAFPGDVWQLQLGIRYTFN
ncbi:MAG: TonB-dependent receptor [Candidatus Kapaibacterium sp.]|nr:MAG: TonB-dependent receptor [Candidatus Kapabacteria bacterium]